MFDLVVSASSIFGGLWEGGAGAIAAENQALAWLAGLAGFPRRRRRVLRQRRLGRQPLGAGDRPPPRPGAGRGAAGALALRHHRRDPRLGARRGPGDGRRRRARAARRARPDDRRRAARGARARRHRRACSRSSPTSARPTSAPSTSSTRSPTCAPSSGCGCTSTPPTAAPRCARRRRPPLRRGLRAGRQLRHRPPQVAVRAVRLRRARVPRAGARRRPPTPSTARTSTWSAARSGTRATSPSTCPGGPAACRCGSAWRPTAPTPTPRPSRRRSTSPAPFAAEVDAARRLLVAAATTALGRAVHGRRLGRGPLRGVEPVAGQGGRRPRRADVVARRGLLPGLPRQPADDDRRCCTRLLDDMAAFEADRRRRRSDRLVRGLQPRAVRRPSTTRPRPRPPA